MSKKFIIALLAALPLVAMADKVLIVNTTTNAVEYPLNNVKEVTIGETGITVVTDDGSHAYNYDEVNWLNFALQATGVNEVAAPQLPTSAAVYNLQGIKLMDAAIDNDGRPVIDQLPAGIYVITMGNKSIKIAKP